MTAIKKSNNPIHDFSETGVHWIEASAGTGKTFTLSAIIVRLLLCGKYLPKHMIATTFTRKAAAELRNRIRTRLYEIARFFNQQQGKTEQELQNIAKTESDPLLQKLLQDYAHDINHAYERLNMVLQQFDEMYIGTLDSFTQKLLREFSFESGVTQQLSISETEKQYILQLIHDALRQWIADQDADLISDLYEQGILKDPENYFKDVESSLNFSPDCWQFPEIPQNVPLASALKLFKAIPFERGEELSFLFPNSEYYSYLYKTSQPITEDFAKEYQHLHQLQQQENFTIPKDINDHLGKLLKIKGKKDMPDGIMQQWQQHPIITACQAYFDYLNEVQDFNKQMQSHLLGYLIQSVQQQLPALL
ncbi:MAG: UvrD-helicase domain-containing protein, partial [Acinetobacter sp.]|nr:UvrD-helicase domain-containing protein [Acinetobacter sp.]